MDKTPKTSEILQKGYYIEKDYLSAEKCGHLLETITAYRQAHQVPRIYQQVKGRSLNYNVITGIPIKTNLPEIYDLYEAVNQRVNRLFGSPLYKLANEEVGVNVNITHPGGEYRWHYDRNLLTGILYLNGVAGGETELFPNYRFLVKSATTQKKLDQLFMAKPVRSLLSYKRLVIPPETGKMVFMLGNTGLHSVRPVTGSQERINIIFSFDLKDKQFRKVSKNLDAYLYKEGTDLNSDPNYS